MYSRDRSKYSQARGVQGMLRNPLGEIVFWNSSPSMAGNALQILQMSEFHHLEWVRSQRKSKILWDETPFGIGCPGAKGLQSLPLHGPCTV